VAALDTAVAVPRLRHAIEQVFSAGDEKTRAALVKLDHRLTTIESEAKFGGTRPITAERVRQPTIDQGVVFEDKLRGLQTLPSRDLRQDTGDRFAHLEKREKEILDIALNQYHSDFGNDQLVLDPNFRTEKPKPKTPPVLRQFHISDMVDEDFAQTKEEDLDTNAIENKAQAIQDNVLQLIWDESKTPNSDVLFDMALQNLNGLRQSIGAQLGLGDDVEAWPPNLRKLVETTAVKIREAIDENLPNQASTNTVTITRDGKDHEVPSSVDINGETYDSPELLGAGGKGMVMRYRLSGGGQDAPTVVIKSTLSGSSDQFMTEDELDDRRPLHMQPQEVQGFKSRAEMVKEAKIHRLVCGGEDGTPSKNVVDLKGMVTGKGGALYMVMEEAKSGDVDHLSKAMSGLVRSGLMPKGAQQALMQDTMLQAAKGLKAMQDIGLIHNDIKTMNFFLDDDGTVKIADFGSGETPEQGRDGDAPETTDRFMAPEFFRGRGDKSDVFMLGTMLHNMDAPYGSEGTFGDMPFNSQFADNAPTGHGSTSLDRLRNAMMEKDPGKRPTLEGVLMSSCLNDARDNFGDPEAPPTDDQPSSDLKPLRLAMAAYVKAAGREVAAVMTELGETMAKHRKLELAAQKKDGDVPAFEQAKQELPGLLKGFQDRLDAINERDDIAPLVKALKEAGEPFGTATGKEKDRAWDFAYAKTKLAMDELGTGTNAPKRPGSLPQDLKEELETVNER
jgi:serine/threonine protein kinase